MKKSKGNRDPSVAVGVTILHRVIKDNEAFMQRLEGVSSQRQGHEQCPKVACSRNTQAIVSAEG